MFIHSIRYMYERTALYLCISGSHHISILYRKKMCLVDACNTPSTINERKLQLAFKFKIRNCLDSKFFCDSIFFILTQCLQQWKCCDGNHISTVTPYPYLCYYIVESKLKTVLSCHSRLKKMRIFWIGAGILIFITNKHNPSLFQKNCNIMWFVSFICSDFLIVSCIYY